MLYVLHRDGSEMIFWLNTEKCGYRKVGSGWAGHPVKPNIRPIPSTLQIKKISKTIKDVIFLGFYIVVIHEKLEGTL